MSSSAIPQTYAQWRHCIEVDCQIALTPSYVESRLLALRHAQGQEAQRFVRLYGQAHCLRVIDWFAQSQREAGHVR